MLRGLRLLLRTHGLLGALSSFDFLCETVCVGQYEGGVFFNSIYLLKVLLHVLRVRTRVGCVQSRLLGLLRPRLDA